MASLRPITRSMVSLPVNGGGGAAGAGGGVGAAGLALPPPLASSVFLPQPAARPATIMARRSVRCMAARLHHPAAAHATAPRRRNVANALV